MVMMMELKRMALLAILAVPACDAFMIAPPSASRQQVSTMHPTSFTAAAAPMKLMLRMAKEEKEETDEVVEITGDVVEEAVESEEESEAVEEEEPKAAESVEEVEPTETTVEDEVAAFKEEINKLETELKSARRKIADTGDRADDFTKTGYARKVAEMENMRRARSMLQSSNKYSATASVLSDFLPTYDTLLALKEIHGEDEFGKKYNALPGAIKTGFSAMGVTDYGVDTGDDFDKSRMVAVESEVSDEFKKDTVIRPVKAGMELQGNVIRLAECVVSLGAEAAATAEVASVEEEDVAEDDSSPTAEAASDEEEDVAEDDSSPDDDSAK